MTYTRVDTVSAVTELARGLFDAERDRPWVVVTSPFGAHEPELDVVDLAIEVGDVSRVFVLETGDLTREFSRLLPDRLDVYGGAGRSYPVGFDAKTSTSESRLRFPQPTAAHATGRLITDVLAHANAAGLFESAQIRSVAAAGTVTGILAGGTRALVNLGAQGMATVWQELTYPPVPLDWTLAQGQPIAGLLDVENRRLNVELETPDTVALAARFPHREVTLAFVEATSERRATLALHPRVHLEITREDVTPNPLDRVDSLLSVGDVVPVRVLHLSGGRLHLSLADVDDDEPILPPVALVDGGPPWLREDRPLVAVDDEPVRSVAVPVPPVPPSSTPSAGGHDVVMAMPVPDAAPIPHSVTRSLPSAKEVPKRAPMPGPGMRRVAQRPAPAAAAEPAASGLTVAVPAESPAVGSPRAVGLVQSQQLTITRLQAENATLTAMLRDAGGDAGSIAMLRNQAMTDRRGLRDALAELGEARARARALEDQLRDQRKQLRQSRRAPAASPVTIRGDDRRARWLDADDWVRHEILLAWVDRVAPSDRVGHPLPTDYVVLSDFAPSLERLDDGQLAKAFKAAVDVLVGRAADVSGRRRHPLRTGDGASAADLVREDGARCFRVSIEQNTPAARRLHYWVRADGAIELSRVVTHDDMGA